jgi:RNA polymerase sigma-70 factor (ECF subfamily)
LLTLYVAKRADLIRFFTTRTSSPSEAEDIVQDIYLKIAQMSPRSIENPAAFLYRLGTNVMLDRVRSRRRSAARDGEYLIGIHAGSTGAETEAPAPSPEATIDAKRRLQELVEAVERLPPQCRRVFVMHKFEDRSYAEIAAELGVSRSAIEKHMITALKRLSGLRA